VTDIERKDIAALHHGLSHIPYQANRTLGVLSKTFNLAEVWGLRPDGSNPCLHVKKFTEQKRGRFLSPEEFAALGATLRDVEEQGSETQSAINAIRLLMLTGCRLGEFMPLTWAYLDRSVHVLPKSVISICCRQRRGTYTSAEHRGRNYEDKTGKRPGGIWRYRRAATAGRIVGTDAHACSRSRQQTAVNRISGGSYVVAFGISEFCFGQQKASEMG
jgi:integrase